ncbi:metal-dependent hydrolase [Crassaminicella thermophila]|uniref:Metal-dependent hydrolase n=1 Tax=Crassaminicella thermophila TaxID=2599308 RepID=A0A5C0SFC9_CRATE|nr:metal-dependent hydrolase [Crassaminicella thermophila]QEK12447.1 metal-dependent hydrolase [Crassaminicella thermophila]
MTGKSHMLFGSVASLYLLPKLGYEPNITTTAAAIIGSLIPDMDHPKAKINQKFLPMNNRFGKILFYCGIGGFLLYKYGFENRLTFTIAILLIMIGFSHHRGFTHSILGTFIISSIVFFVLKNTIHYSIILSFILGLISHIIGDWMTIAGIELFYPISTKRYRFVLTISSGKMAEPIIGMFFIYLIIRFYIKNDLSMHWLYSLLSLIN